MKQGQGIIKKEQINKITKIDLKNSLRRQQEEIYRQKDIEKLRNSS